MREWRPILLARLVAWIVIIGFPVAFVAVMVSVWDDASERSAAAATMGIFGLLPIGAWRGALIPYVRADEAALTIRNPFQTHRVTYKDILGATPGYGGVAVHRRDGSSVTAWAVQKSNLATWRNRHTRADEVCEFVNSRTGSDLPAHSTCSDRQIQAHAG